MCVVLLEMLTGGPGRALSLTDFRFAFSAMALVVLLSSPGFLGLTLQDGNEVSGHRVRPANARPNAGT